MQESIADEGELIKEQNSDHATQQNREGVGSNTQRSHVPPAHDNASGPATGTATSQQQSPAADQAAGDFQRTSHSQLPQSLSLRQQIQSERQDASNSKSASPGSTEQTAEVKLQSEERSEHSELPPSAPTSHHRDTSEAAAPATSSASVWLPELTAVVEQQRQQQTQTLTPPLSSLHQQHTHQPQQQHLHSSHQHAQQHSHLLPDLHQQRLQPPLGVQHQLSGQQHQQSADDDQIDLASGALHSQHQARSGSYAARQQAPDSFGGGQPQQRDAAAQTDMQMHRNQLLAPEREPVSGATDSGGDGSGDESSDKLGESRGAKKPRLVWTSELHARFMNAVNHLGVKNAVPKTILQLMNVDGMTRENVASHLQKYRLYLKKLGGYPANAKTTPEALQQVQQQALQQQAHEAFQHSLSAMQGLPTHNPNQGYFGPSSLGYTHSMTAGAPPEGFQMQGPQGPSAAPPGWFPAPGSGNQAFEGQRGPAMQQMASAYGLLNPRGPQAVRQSGAAPFVQPGSQAAWSWGQGGSQGGWGAPNSMEASAGPHGSLPRHLAPNAMFDHPGDDPDPTAGAARTGSDVSSGQMPDALAHLLSAAEAASSERR